MRRNYLKLDATGIWDVYPSTEAFLKEIRGSLRWFTSDGQDDLSYLLHMAGLYAYRHDSRTFVPAENERATVKAMAEKRFGATGIGKTMTIGDAKELREHFAALAERGVERFYVWFLDFGKPDTLAAFGRDVIGPAS